MLYARRLNQAATSLAACPCPPRHLELSAPPTFTSLSAGVAVSPAALLVALAPLGPHLISLSLDVDTLAVSDARAIATHLPALRSLTLHLTGRECGTALGELLSALPKLDYLQLSNGGGRLMTQVSVWMGVDGGSGRRWGDGLKVTGCKGVVRYWSHTTN